MTAQINQPYSGNRIEVGITPVPGGGTNVPDVPPNDGKLYVIQNGVWVLNPLQLVSGTTNNYQIADGLTLVIDAGSYDV